MPGLNKLEISLEMNAVPQITRQINTKYFTPVNTENPFDSSVLANKYDPRNAEKAVMIIRGRRRFLLMYLTGLFSLITASHSFMGFKIMFFTL
jgi:hypothetical protein